MHHRPLRIAVIGMGGFAAEHHNALPSIEQDGIGRLICACDPAMDQFAARQQELNFAGRGVRVFSDYLAMLDACGANLDLVCIPTPIPLHAPMHRACVERGLAVYLEKPPTLDYEELNAMLAVEASALKETQVGFNYIVEAPRQALKRRLVNGEFGALRRVSVIGHWPRQTAYFRRASWAGRLLLNDRLVLDSCMGNAMAHILHNGLFWAGSHELWAWGEVDWVEAELYRAHAIEGTDTVFVCAGMAGGPELRVAMSHAGTGTAYNKERVTCEEAEITYIAGVPSEEGNSVNVRWRDGHEERIPTQTVNLEVNLRAYCAYLRDELPRPMTRLADSRPFVELNNLAYVAAGHITTVAGPYCEAHTDDTLSIIGVGDALETFAATGAFPSAQRLPWATRGAARVTRAELPQLSATVRRMISALPAPCAP